MNRFVIFACSYNEDKLYEYQQFLLRAFKKIAADVVVVSNGFIKESIRKELEESGIEIRHSGSHYDVGMWKEVIRELYSTNRMKIYDELILLNDSVFGPLYPLSRIWEQMDEKKTDFWGITAHPAMTLRKSNGVFIEIPRFLQRYMIVFRKKILSDRRFEAFWSDLPEMSVFSDTEEKFEFVFAERFKNWGYEWDALCDTGSWENSDSRKALSFLLFSPYKLLSEKRMPFISKQLFYLDREVDLCYHTGDEISKSLKYIKNHTEYNLNNIYEYLLDNLNVYDLWDRLNLSYVLSASETGKRAFDKKIVMVAHLYYSDLFFKSIQYLARLPEEIDLIITTDSAEKVKSLNHICAAHINNKFEIICVGNTGREWGALLLYVKDRLDRYDYLGFIHDKKSAQMYYSTVGECFNDYLWENMLSGTGYICRIIELLNYDEKLGILTPPPVYHGEFWGHAIDFWTICYNKTLELGKRLNLKHLPEREKPVLTIGSTFWCKTDAIKPLLQFPFSKEDFPGEPMEIDGTFNHALERIISFVAQDRGFYTGTLINTDYAGTELINLRIMLQKILKGMEDRYNLDTVSPFGTIESLYEENKVKKTLLQKIKKIRKC